ncbi:bowman-birk serine protease inhibitor family protein (macronuclear) [Tetrahymena thermophila SB210]|uniref:Bowman-birk serine protease inhibitor family protein n=1 Tax=Tetrahymena thermophila (strain SB210) TaxID=312017 RepID=I7M8F9_TETTS|nr:bowman-birk serine protease inhibitor family protein [Tetrahymena thermophila SB210]EAR98004.2 bowman-birk serine protease inhibitor family protein [Tetrahymena thermophila SB210]|eukprot:XP_001018249.2 bowman-birk serine protease inhibitor family protein [Tetrahymena thermophila SB210]
MNKQITQFIFKVIKKYQTKYCKTNQVILKMSFFQKILLFIIFNYFQPIVLSLNWQTSFYPFEETYLRKENQFQVRKLLMCHPLCQTCIGSDQYSCTSCDSSKNLVQSGTSSPFQCVCQQNYYLNSNSCSKCDLSCKSCNGGNNQNCTQCQSNRTFSNGRCLCNPSFYDDGSGNCLACIANCLNCSSTNPLQCIQCSQNRIFQNSICECIQGYYENGSLCIQCNSLCKICKISKNTSCDQCLENSSLQNSQCVCNQGYFQNNQNQCQQCDHTCQNCLGPGSNQCQTCNQNYYLDSLNQCQKCYSACQFCSGPASNQCTNCVQNRNLSNGICYCNDGYYEDLSHVCQPCQYSCSKCNNGTANDCTACQANRQFKGGLCVCNDGYFDNSINQICSKCHYSCATCSNSQKNYCLICQANRTKQNDGSCLCNQGYFDDSNQQLCQQCHYSCSTCLNSLQTSCITCQANRSQQNDGSCHCNQGFYDDSASQKCQQCHFSCQTCQNSSQNGCLTCKQFRFFQNGICNCSDGYYEDSKSNLCQPCQYSCSKCTNSTANDCIACQANRQLQGNQCLCIDGYFEDVINKTCSQCHYSCATCSNSQNNSCLSCQQNRTPQMNGTCLCNQGFYDDSNSKQCQPCHYSCQTCSGRNINNCLQCQSNRTQQGNTCICNQGYYDDTLIQTCVPCHYSCQTCQNSSFNGCQTCKSNRNFSAGSCPCKSGFYDDTQTKNCLPCQYSCLTCTAGSSSDCSSCQADRYIQNGMCLCYPGQYDDTQNKKCSPCNYTCQTCNGNSTNSCTSCNSTRYLTSNSQGNCLCKQSYYEESQNSLCKPCDKSCLNCIGPSPSMCTQCDSSKNFTPLNSSASQFSCVCISNSFYDPQNIVCILCNYRCATCNGALQTQCLSCLPSLYRELQGSSCVCIQGYFENAKGQCQPCHSSCYNCIGPTKFQCSQCDSSQNRFYNQNYSTCDCIQGFYNILQPFQAGKPKVQTCLQCNFLCSYCTSNSSCLGCINNLILLPNFQCSCPEGTYLDKSTNYCLQCYQTCQSCVGPNQQDCLKCKLNLIQTPSYTQAVSPFNKLYKCICSQQNCIKCHYSCQLNSCNPDKPNICQNCLPNRQLVQKQLQGQSAQICICNDGFYEDEITLQCKPCNQSCATCLGPSEYDCITCNQNRIIDLQNSLIYGRCLCKNGYFQNELTQQCQKCNNSCASCAGNSNFCTSCQQNAFLNSLGICTCIPSYFLSQEGECLKCHYSCENCFGPTEFDCLQCSSKTRTQLIISQSPPKITCYCNQGFYDSGVNDCQACSPICMSCIQSSDHCLSCYPQEISKRILVNNQCVCKEGYKENKSGICVQCPYDCLMCDNNGNCITCSNSLRVLNPLTKRCSCREGYYEANDTSCQKCSYRCKNCNTNPNLCSECHTNSYLNNHSTCICMDGFYEMQPTQDQINKIPEIQFQICQKCNYRCNTCDNSTTCTSCLLSNSNVYFNLDTQLCECYFGFQMVANLQANTFSCIQQDNFTFQNTNQNSIQHSMDRVLGLLMYIFNITAVFSLIFGQFIVSDLGFQTCFDFQLLLYYNGMKLNLIIDFLEALDKNSIFKLLNYINLFKDLIQEENYLSVYQQYYKISTNLYQLGGGAILLWAIIQIANLVLNKTIFHKRYVLLDQIYKISKGRIFLSKLYNNHIQPIIISTSNVLVYYLFFALILGVQDGSLKIYLPSYIILALLIIYQLFNIKNVNEYFQDPFQIFQIDQKIKYRYKISIIQLIISCIQFQILVSLSNFQYLAFIMYFKIIYASLNILKFKGKKYFFQIAIISQVFTLFGYLNLIIITYLTEKQYVSQDQQNLIITLSLIFKLNTIIVLILMTLVFIFDFSFQLYSRRNILINEETILQKIRKEIFSLYNYENNLNLSDSPIIASNNYFIPKFKQIQLNQTKQTQEKITLPNNQNGKNNFQKQLKIN